MSDEERFACEVSSQEWYFEEIFRSGTDYALRHDPAYIKWSEQRRIEGLEAQMEMNSPNNWLINREEIEMKALMYIGNTKKSVKSTTNGLIRVLKECGKSEFSDEVTIHAIDTLKVSFTKDVSVMNCNLTAMPGRKVRGKK